MQFDRRAFIASLGGAGVFAAMTVESKADALEEYLQEELNEALDDEAPKKKFPTVAELEAQIETRPVRQGAGRLFSGRQGNVKRLEPMPAAPTVVDFFKLRFADVSNHCLQSANRAMQT